jgi:hypothetical protein
LISDVRQLLLDAGSALETAGIAYAVIGGCARNAYAEPRATKDVDFVAAGDLASYEAAVKALAARGFLQATTVGEETEPVPDLVLYRDTNRRRVDILFAKTEFERSALARRETRAPYDAVQLPVVSPEDLIVYKLIAGRTQDFADVEVVITALAVEQRALDWTYIDKWCAEWDVAERAARVRPRTG